MKKFLIILLIMFSFLGFTKEKVNNPKGFTFNEIQELKTINNECFLFEIVDCKINYSVEWDGNLLEFVLYPASADVTIKFIPTGGLFIKHMVLENNASEM